MLDNGFQGWQVDLDNLPDTVDLEIEIAVGCDVPEAVDRSPSDLGMPSLGLRSEPIRRFRKCLESSEDSILDVDVVDKRLTPFEGPLLDQADSVTDVGEKATLAVVAHSVMASRRI